MSDSKKKNKPESSKIRVNRALIETINEQLDKILIPKKLSMAWKERISLAGLILNMLPSSCTLHSLTSPQSFRQNELNVRYLFSQE